MILSWPLFVKARQKYALAGNMTGLLSPALRMVVAYVVTVSLCVYVCIYIYIYNVYVYIIVLSFRHVAAFSVSRFRGRAKATSCYMIVYHSIVYDDIV